MFTKKGLFIVLVVSAIMLAAGVGPQMVSTAHAVPQAQASIAIPYSGRLNDEAGQSVPDGAYDFTFALYDAKADGALLWSETQKSVPVKGGAFAASLGAVTPIAANVLGSDERWLAVGVRGPGETNFIALTPRQSLNAVSPAAPAAPQALSCAHTHLGETWNAGINTVSNGLAITGTLDWSRSVIRGVNYGTGPSVWGQNYSGSGNGVRGQNYSSGIGVYGASESGVGVAGSSGSVGVQGTGSITGVVGSGTNTSGPAYGVYGETASNAGGSGVYGKASTTTGYADGVTGLADAYSSVGGRFNNNGGGVALWASSDGSGADRATFRAHNANPAGGVTAYLTNNSTFATTHIENSGAGEVVFLKSNGGTFLRALNNVDDPKFRLDYDGWGRSDAGWTTPASDFAEMFPAVKGLEPGDVLVIGPDGKLARSAEAYQSTVVGVYSTKPGFVGGSPVDGETGDTIPLAVVGIVPTKVSAENGAIQPGDLLVASATPGHAMKAGSNPPQGTVIGKALEKLDAGTGAIKILATLQ